MFVEKLFNCFQYRRTLWDLLIKLYHKNDVSQNYGLQKRPEINVRVE